MKGKTRKERELFSNIGITFKVIPNKLFFRDGIQFSRRQCCYVRVVTLVLCTWAKYASRDWLFLNPPGNSKITREGYACIGITSLTLHLLWVFANSSYYSWVFLWPSWPFFTFDYVVSSLMSYSRFFFRYIKLSCPNCNNLIVLGCVFIYISVYMVAIDGKRVDDSSLAGLCMVGLPWKFAFNHLRLL